MRRPSPSLLIALLALFVAAGGPAEAAKLINGKKIRKGTVTSRQVKNRSLSTRDLSRRTVSSLRTRAREVGSAEIVDGSIALADLGPNSVTGNQVADRSLSAIDLTPDSLTAGELAVNSVGESELAEASVTGRKIRTGAVSKGKIGAGDVGAEEVIDRDLTGTDVGRASGAVTYDFGVVPAATCASGGPDYVLPAGQTLADAVVLVGAPSALPDGLLVSGRATEAGVLRVQVCNPTKLDSADLPPLTFPYVAIAP